MDKNFFWDIISISIVGIAIYPLFRYISTHDFIHLIIFIGIFVADTTSKIIKLFLNKFKINIFGRPRGAINCDIFCRNGNVEGNPGTPSGHMTMVTFFAIYFLWYELKWHYRTIRFWFVIVFVIIMAAARMTKKCHNLLQVILGTLLGGSSSSLVLLFSLGKPS
jgi:membrane-associated phospholipid phosphatase